MVYKCTFTAEIAIIILLSSTPDSYNNIALIHCKMFTLVVVILSVAAFGVNSQNEVQLIMWADMLQKPCNSYNFPEDRKNHELPFESVKEALEILTMAMLSNNEHVKARLDWFFWSYITSVSKKGFIAEKWNGNLVVVFKSVKKFYWKDHRFLFPLEIAPGNVTVDKYYYKAANRTYRLVEETLLNKAKSGKKIYITGLSLGAGIAQVFAFEFARHHPSYRSQLRLFTYGATPTGNDKFTEQLHNYIPHFYDIVVIGDKLSYHKCPWLSSAENYDDSEYRRLNVYYLPYIGGHNYDEYKAQLEKIQRKEFYDIAYGFSNETFEDACSRLMTNCCRCWLR
jgi:hypothetical protein